MESRQKLDGSLSLQDGSVLGKILSWKLFASKN